MNRRDCQDHTEAWKDHQRLQWMNEQLATKQKGCALDLVAAVFALAVLVGAVVA